MMEKDEQISKFLKSNPTVQSSFLEYPLPILIQSGDIFTLNKFNVSSDTNKLNSETVYINVCGKYKDMNVMASRTLLVNPEDSQKKAYNLTSEALDVCIKNIVVGQPIKNAYIAAKEFIRSKNPDLATHLHNNFGFGIGCSIKEDALMINETNETLVQPNMAFHVRITLSEVHKKPSRGIIAIGETVFVDSEGK